MKGKGMKKIVLLLLAVMMLCPVLEAQELSGVITRKGKPKKGLVVSISSSNETTTTDKYGRFYFKNAAPGDILQINVTKRKAARIEVSDARRLRVYIDPNDFVLNNGVLEQRLPYMALASADTKLKGTVVEREQFIGSGLQKVTDILRHHMTGISVEQTFIGSTIRVRGVNSVGGDNSPLFVVDGVECPDVDIDALLPVESIERIELHKDGSRWGARGANGVIEITTLGVKMASM